MSMLNALPPFYPMRNLGKDLVEAVEERRFLGGGRMNIENVIESRLWEQVSKSYEERNYSTAILDAIQYLGDTIREKTGLASDGMTLIGEAFGGSKPKLKVNRFQTETEKNIQGGIEHLARGLYKTFRNPRSHEKVTDSQEDANTVLLMVNYLLKVIGQSKAPFDKSKFMERVFDNNFVENGKYAELLVSEVPIKHLLDILLDVYRNRSAGETDKLTYVIEAFWAKLSEESKVEFAQIASDELNTLVRNEVVSFIRLMPQEFWGYCSDAARMRVENMLISAAEDGRYKVGADKCISGAAGTWMSTLMPGALLGNEMQNVVAELLGSAPEQSDYAFYYLLPSIICNFQRPTYALRVALIDGLESGDPRFKDALKVIDALEIDDNLNSTGEYEYPEWRRLLITAVNAFEEKEHDDLPL